MDGQYGNVSFICTQTDDLEATETMRDHADVARQEPGRWEKMTELSEAIDDLEKQRNHKAQEEEALKTQLEEASKERLNEAKGELKEASEENEDDTDVDIDQLTELYSQLVQKYGSP
jgi:chromosome segregation ATPase